MNTSNIKKNNSFNQFKGINTICISSPQSIFVQKKLQGFDLNSTAKSNAAFSKKIDQLKNQPKKQSIEDQYIKGLQDEIHYLQMQLKLLQQKEQLRNGEIDQLQKFFSDGVPINENILAIKNGFNNYRNEKQKAIKELTNQKKQRETLIEGLNKKIKQMEKQLENQEKDVRAFELVKTAELHNLLKTEARLKKQIQLDDCSLKALKNDVRKLSQKFASLQRNKQILMVTTLKKENHKMDKLSKIKQSIIEKQFEFTELEKQYEDLVKQQEEKSYVIKVEEDNLNLKKKIISMERELNALDTKAKEKQMQLDAQLKQRLKQISAKVEMKTRLQSQRLKISKQNSMKVQDIQKVARQKQINLLQKIIIENKKLLKYINHYEQLLSKVQHNIQQMVQNKPELKSQINAYINQVQKVSINIKNQKLRQAQIYSDIVEKQAKNEFFKVKSPPLQEIINKTKQYIKIYNEQRQKLKDQIKIKEKQLDLILILRSLNLDEVEMSKSSSGNIQQKLSVFIRSWQQLQRAS